MDVAAVKKVSATLGLNHKCSYRSEVLPECVSVHVPSVCEMCVSKCLGACVCVCASLCESEFLRSGSRAAAACEAVNSGHQSHQHTEQGRNPTSIHVTLQHIKRMLIHSSPLSSDCTVSGLAPFYSPLSSVALLLSIRYS